MRLHLNGQVKDNQYIYTNHLLAFDSCHPLHTTPSSISEHHKVYTPLILERWSDELLLHPDQCFVQYILNGITNGFRIGFDHHCPLQQPDYTMLTQNPSIIAKYLQREVALGRMKCFPTTGGHSSVHLSPIGAIPKKHRPGKWRLIVDLSSPSNASVNDGISSEWSSLRYPTIDHLSSLILQEGMGAFLVKADLKEAYRMIPVHPHGQLLLGVEWDGAIFTDMALPFGLRLAPTAVADALQWILVHKGIKTILHYLDDFILVASSLAEANAHKEILLATTVLWVFPLSQQS